MRTINATLLSNQSSLSGRPYRVLTIGTAPNTIDISNYMLSYDYEERTLAETGSGTNLTITLDNSTGYFNSLSGDKAYIKHGADVELKRGLTVSGTDYTEELPTCYVEVMTFDYVGGTSIFVIECLDAWGKLAHHRLTTAQTWSATSATTILEWILTQASLTRLAGSMTALTLDFDIQPTDNLASALKRLIRKMPEYLYAGIDKEIKWKDIDGGDSSDYTFGWNANHPLLSIEGGTSAWEINSITVNGKSAATGSASDATQITNVGTRHLTIYDPVLDSNGECAARAQAELDQFEADATLATLVCRPCHGLELYDVITADSPPWGGSNIVGRVIRFREEWNHDGRWHQVTGLGAVPDKDPGNQPTAKKRRKGRRRRRSKSSRRSSKYSTGYAPGAAPWDIPVGGIILWSGAVAGIPTNWALCDGNNSTPDLRNRFVVGAGDAYNPADTGGEDASDLQHNHGPGTLNTDNDAHTHGPGSLNTDNDAHTHGSGSLSTDTDGHFHGINPLAEVQGSPGSGIWIGSSATDIDNHDHNVDSGTTASDTHDHDVNSGTTASDTHDHDVDSGTTANAGSTTQENRPQYYALAFIMRIA